MNRALLAFGLLAAAPAAAESLVAARTIPARSAISIEDLRLVSQEIPGALGDPASVEGMEAKVTIYEGRPLRAGDLAPPALVERNDLIRLVFRRGPLEIETDGRALDRAREGEPARAMNLSSRSIVVGVVAGPGLIEVGVRR